MGRAHRALDELLFREMDSDRESLLEIMLNNGGSRVSRTKEQRYAEVKKEEYREKEREREVFLTIKRRSFAPEGGWMTVER